MLTRLLAVAALLSGILACAAQPPAYVPDIADRLAWGDHRFLETLEVNERLIATLRERDPALPYVLARALEARGLRAAAREVYASEADVPDSAWAGFSIARLALDGIDTASWASAIDAGRLGVSIAPTNRDVWFALGEGLYRAERWEELDELLSSMPDSSTLVTGERISPAALHAERALWDAVTGWELDRDDQARFVRAFVSVPVDPIHRRLYLYLFYRSGALDSFAADDRLVLEAVYRASIDEAGEARRLLRRIDSARLRRVLEQDGAAFTQTLERLASESDGTYLSWIDSLRSERAADASAETEHRLALVASRAAAASGDRTRAALILLETAEAIRDTDAPPLLEIRETARARWVDLAVERGEPLAAVVDVLARWGVSDALATRAVDRLAPALVARSGIGALAGLAGGVPQEWSEVRAQLAVAAALDRRQRGLDLPRDLLVPALERPVIEYYGLVARSLVGESAVADLADEEPVLIGDGFLVAELRHADALINAGQVWPALSLAMRAALDPVAAPEALAVARRMAELGYTAAALDVARRATVRGVITPSLADISMVYPTAFVREISASSERWSVPTWLMLGLVREESHFNPRARSIVGATGLAQLMPATAAEVAARIGIANPDLENPAVNLDLGTSYMAWLAERFPDAPLLRVASYNAGPGRGRTWNAQFGTLPGAIQVEAVPIIETRWYLRRVAVSSSWYRWLIEGVDPAEAIASFLDQEEWFE